MAAAEGSTEAPDVEERVLAWYREYGEAVFRYLMRGFRCSIDDCEEVVQETFVNLLQTLRRTDDAIEHPKAWLFAVARRTMLDRVKHARHADRLHPVYVATPSPNVSVATSGASAEARVVRREHLDALVRGVQRMTEIERRCFLARMTGLKLREIAVLEDLDPRRVAEAVSRGVEKVQRILEEHRGARRARGRRTQGR